MQGPAPELPGGASARKVLKLGSRTSGTDVTCEPAAFLKMLAFSWTHRSLHASARSRSLRSEPQGLVHSQLHEPSQRAWWRFGLSLTAVACGPATRLPHTAADCIKIEVGGLVMVDWPGDDSCRSG